LEGFFTQRIIIVRGDKLKKGKGSRSNVCSKSAALRIVETSFNLLDHVSE
jgi:hypothetical protein